MNRSKKSLIGGLALAAAACLPLQAAEPEFRSINLEIEIDRPAAEVWSKVGGYCQISVWLNLDCKITSGDGKSVGTVRSLAQGRVTEVLVGQTELSYGYAFPFKQGEFNNFYHGFMEARPLSATKSKIVYALLLDVSDKADAAAKDADIARRKTMFEGALKKMKEVAEAK